MLTLTSHGGGGGGGGGGVEYGFSCSNFLMKKDIDMKFWLIVNGLTKKLADFCKIKHCPYLSEGEEGSMLYITGIKAFCYLHGFVAWICLNLD